MKYPIPNAALDDRLAWTGTSGTGKTYDSGTAIERVLNAKSRACIIDPLGVWWGLRLNADGKRAGFDVAIFGGPHGDIAITETSGRLIGEAVAGTKESCIIDLSDFDTEAGQRRFMLAFLVALYNGLKGDLLHLVLDEADMWAPQRIMDKEGDATKLHHNVQKVVRRGRVKGFIPWLITQRPAELSKSVLSQVDGIVAHQLTAPQDVNALMDWVSGHADKGTIETIRTGLPGFARGEAAVYIPRRRVLQIAQFPTKVTFDSSRSPERGERKNRPDVVLKPLDIASLKQRLEKVDAEAKANDPHALKAEIAKLRQQLAAGAREKKSAADPAQLEQAEQRGYAKGYSRGKIDGYGEAVAGVTAEFAGVVSALQTAEQAFKNIRVSAAQVEKWAKRKPQTASTPPASMPASSDAPRSSAPVKRSAPIAVPRQATADGSISSPEQRILNSLATWRAMDHDAPSNAQVAWLAGYSPTSTSYTNPRGALNTKGLVTYPEKGRVSLTDAGGAVASAQDITGGLLEHVLGQLPQPEQRILRAAAERHPNGSTNEEIAEAAGYSATSTSYTNPRGALKTKELITYPMKGSVRAADWLF